MHLRQVKESKELRFLKLALVISVNTDVIDNGIDSWVEQRVK